MSDVRTAPAPSLGRGRPRRPRLARAGRRGARRRPRGPVRRRRRQRALRGPVPAPGRARADRRRQLGARHPVRRRRTAIRSGRGAGPLRPAELLWQLLLAVLIGLVPLLVTLARVVGDRRAASARSSGRTFWTVTQGSGASPASASSSCVQVRQAWTCRTPASRHSTGGSLFGVVAFAMILAGVRMRRAPTAQMR